MVGEERSLMLKDATNQELAKALRDRWYLSATPLEYIVAEALARLIESLIPHSSDCDTREKAVADIQPRLEWHDTE